jgi:hypothetical protein
MQGILSRASDSFGREAMPNDAAPDPSEFYKKWFGIENSLTRNILKAIPRKLDYRPHERSPSTGQIAWTIVRGLYVRVDMVSQCFSHVDPHPAMAEILGRFEDTTRRHIAQLDSFPARQWTRSASYPPAIVLSWGARPVTSSGFSTSTRSIIVVRSLRTCGPWARGSHRLTARLATQGSHKGI